VYLPHTTAPRHSNVVAATPKNASEFTFEVNRVARLCRDRYGVARPESEVGLFMNAWGEEARVYFSSRPDELCMPALPRQSVPAAARAPSAAAPAIRLHRQATLPPFRRRSSTCESSFAQHPVPPAPLEDSGKAGWEPGLDGSRRSGAEQMHDFPVLSWTPGEPAERRRW